MAGSQPTPTFVIRGLPDPVHSVALTEDEQTLWAGDSSGRLSVFSLQTRRKLRDLPGLHAAAILRLQLDGSHILTQARDGFVKETDAETGAALQTLRTGSHAFCSARFFSHPALALSPLVLSPGLDPSIVHLWSWKENKPMFTFTPDESRTEKLKFGMCMAVDVVDVEGKPLIVTAYENGSLYWWDPRTQRILFQLPQVFPEPILAFQLDQKGTKGVLGGAEESLVHFSVDYAASAASVTSRTALAQRGVDAIALRHDEALFATAGWDHRVRLYAWSDGRPLAILKYHSEGVSSVLFGRKSNLIVTAGKDSKIALWNLY